MVMVPLVHEQLGFGVLIVGRGRNPQGTPSQAFSDEEVESLMNFADDAASSLRTAVLLRHLKHQLNPTD
jgi:GAF domain-containing protein